MTTLNDIIDNFEFLEDWEDKYRYVIDLGKKLPDLSDDEKIDTNKVKGCVANVWLIGELDYSEPDNPVITFKGASDAHIVNGLVAIMLMAFSGIPAKDINSVDENALFKKLNLLEHLTPQRANGLRAMVVRIKQYAKDAIS